MKGLTVENPITERANSPFAGIVSMNHASMGLGMEGGIFPWIEVRTVAAHG